MPSLMALIALKAATDEPSWHLSTQTTTMSGSVSSR
jgi:hypothetical protein